MGAPDKYKVNIELVKNSSKSTDIHGIVKRLAQMIYEKTNSLNDLENWVEAERRVAFWITEKWPDADDISQALNGYISEKAYFKKTYDARKDWFLALDETAVEIFISTGSS